MDHATLQKEYEAMLAQRDRHKQQIDALQKVMFIHHAALKQICETPNSMSTRSLKVIAAVAMKNVGEIVEIG